MWFAEPLARSVVVQTMVLLGGMLTAKSSRGVCKQCWLLISMQTLATVRLYKSLANTVTVVLHW